MNWLDGYLVEYETGYYVSEDGSCWADWGVEKDGEWVRLATGSAGEPIGLTEISRETFIAHLTGGNAE